MSDQDLLSEFFARNMDVPEDAALAALLESSPEAAERFAALAQLDYERLGLPAPVLPNPLLGRLKYGALGLLAAGALLWWWTLPTQTLSVAVGTVAEPEREVSLSPAAPRRHAHVRHDGEDLQPKTLDQAGSAGLPRLSIRMETRQGPFTVTVSGGSAQPVGVLDSGGNLVGRLQPEGPQSWSWDTKGKDGQPMAPGRYRICLLAGDQPLRQWVEIERR
ncbi:MAG TPA: FlgD immunoglobulin-like domain containing protein [bacterium]|jgi:hypothetical protein|nr:FlgD immunoglobulin-like domain containing protein [bacterium]